MYLITCTICLIFEVCLKPLYSSKESNKLILFTGLKTLIIVMISVVITFILLKYVLIPFEQTFILPFIIIILIGGLSFPFELLNNNNLKNKANDYILCFIAIFIATSEDTSLLVSILIAITAVICHYLLLYVIFCTDKQNSSVIKLNTDKTIPLLLLTLATILLVSYSWNISWLSIRFF